MDGIPLVVPNVSKTFVIEHGIKAQFLFQEDTIHISSTRHESEIRPSCARVPFSPEYFWAFSVDLTAVS